MVQNPSGRTIPRLFLHSASEDCPWDSVNGQHLLGPPFNSFNPFTIHFPYGFIFCDHLLNNPPAPKILPKALLPGEIQTKRSSVVRVAQEKCIQKQVVSLLEILM